MRTLIQDVRHALRLFARNPGFTAVSALTIALAIGGCTAVFSVVNGVLLSPLPYPEPDRVVTVAERHPGSPAGLGGLVFSNHTYYAWLANAKTSVRSSISSCSTTEPCAPTWRNRPPTGASPWRTTSSIPRHRGKSSM